MYICTRLEKQARS